MVLTVHFVEWDNNILEGTVGDLLHDQAVSNGHGSSKFLFKAESSCLSLHALFCSKHQNERQRERQNERERERGTGLEPYFYCIF